MTPPDGDRPGPPSRGRGRPTLLTPAARDRYLAARRTGATQEKAAAAAGIAAKTIRDIRRRDPDFRNDDDQARLAGRLARVPHGEYRRIHLKCGCPTCVHAASSARAARRTRAATAGPPAPVVALPPATAGSSKDFPLARAS